MALQPDMGKGLGQKLKFTEGWVRGGRTDYINNGKESHDCL